MDNAESVVGADFLLPAVQVVLHRLLGKAEVTGDFIVGEAFGDERDELLLAAGQPQAQVHAGRWEAGGFALEVVPSIVGYCWKSLYELLEYPNRSLWFSSWFCPASSTPIWDFLLFFLRLGRFRPHFFLNPRFRSRYFRTNIFPGRPTPLRVRFPYRFLCRCGSRLFLDKQRYRFGKSVLPWRPTLKQCVK